MSNPVRYPNGVSTTSNIDPLRNLVQPDPTKLVMFYDDFHTYTAAQWTVTETDAASTQAINAGAHGGILALTHDVTTATAVNQMQLISETFRLNTAKQFWMKTRLSATAGTMANYGILVGLAITDTSAVAGVSDGIYFRKSTGASILEAVAEKDSAETSIQLAAAPGLVTATFYELAMYYNGRDTLEAYLNGVKMGSTTTLTNYCTDEDLAVTIAAVNATAGAANVLSVDYLLIAQER